MLKRNSVKNLFLRNLTTVKHFNAPTQNLTKRCNCIIGIWYVYQAAEVLGKILPIGWQHGQD